MDTVPSPRPSSPFDLFRTFTVIALQGFGGVLAISQDVLCDRKRWLGNDEYAEMLALAQVLPGPNVCNLALIVGDRFFAWRGAFSALAGMMLVPFCIVLALTAAYTRFASLPEVAGATRGVAAVAAGLIMATALKLAATLRDNPMGLVACTTLAGAVFAGIALFHWPVAAIVVATGTAALAWAWRCVGVSSSSEEDES